MTLEEFLRKNVDKNRGGYCPDEVAHLIIQAWGESANETSEMAKQQIGRALEQYNEKT